MIRTAFFLVMTVLLAACGETVAPPSPVDSGGGEDEPLEPKTAPERPARYYYKRAQRTLGFSLYDAALADLDLALEKEPDHAPSLALRGMVRMERLLRALAKRDLDSPIVKRGPFVLPGAVARFTASFEGFVEGSVRVGRQGDVEVADEGALEAALAEDARRIASAAAEEAERDDELQLALGLHAYRLGALRDALGHFRAAGETSAALTAAGLVEERLGNIADAIASYERGLAAGTPDLAYWLRRGVEPETFRWLPAAPGAGLPGDAPLDLREVLAAAEVDLDAALELDGGDDRARELRGLVNLLTDRPAAARADLERAVKNSPERARSWYLLARAILADDASAHEAAASAWRRSWKIDARYLLHFHDASWVEPPDVDHVYQELKGLR